MLAQGIQQHRSLPEEHPRVPIKVACLEKTRCSRRVGLLAKALDRQRLRAAGLDALGKLDVAIAGLGPSGLDPQDHDLPGSCGFQSRFEQPDVLPRLADHMVGWNYTHDRFRIEPVE